MHWVAAVSGGRRAVVVGAGIAGLATALTLRRTGWHVTVCERATELRGGAYVVRFSGLGYDAAERLGLLDRLRRLESPWTGAQYIAGDGRVLAKMGVGLHRALVGPKTIFVLRGDLERVLADAVRENAREAPVDLRFGTTVTGVGRAEDSVTVTLQDGSRLEADLLVGADGLNSWVRRSVFGPDAGVRHDLGADVAAFALPDPPDELAGRTTYFAEIGRGIGVYPQRDGGLAAFFTVTADPTGTAQRAADPVGFLRETYGDLGWVWPALLDRADAAEAVFFDSISQIRMARWSRDRVVLVGDAAWSVSLLAGYGASLAVGGGEVLGTLLAEHADVDEAIRRWERQMQPVVSRKHRAGRRARWLFVPRNRGQLALRTAGVRLAGSRFTAAVAGLVLSAAPTPRGDHAASATGQTRPGRT